MHACCPRTAGEGDEEGFVEALQRLAPCAFRPGQRETIAALATGRDVLTRQPTGSGKSLVVQVAAAKAWLDGPAVGGDAGSGDALANASLPPMAVMVVPWRALAFDQEAEANQYFQKLWADSGRCGSMMARALFVDRGSEGQERDARAPGADAPGEAGGSVPELPPQPSSSSPQPQPDHSSLAPGDAREGGGGGASSWEKRCCRFEWEGETMRWCKWCSKPSNNGTQRVTGCLERKRRLQSTREPPVVVVAPSSHARATRGSEAASRATPTSASPPPQAERRPLRLADLPKTAPERRILEDPALAVLLVCPESLEAQSERGKLLWRALETCGRVRLIVYDEAHACLRISQASFRGACARMGATVAQLTSDMAAHGHPRPQLLAQTATMPPAMEAEAVRRLRLDDDHVVVRGPVDRPEIAMVRCLLPELSDQESAAQYALRAWRLVERQAPPEACAGHKIVFVTIATRAPITAAYLEQRGVKAAPYATNGMTPEARAESLARWRADPDVLLIASGAFGQGVNQRTVSLVITLGLSQDPLELAQQMGRIRGSGLLVAFLRPRFLSERLRLPAKSTDDLNDRVQGVTQLLGVLTQPWCLRRSLVEWLGGSVARCAGCDACVVCRGCAVGADLVDASCCGSLAFGTTMQVATDAARRVLGALSATEHRLADVFSRIPDGAPPPFDEADGHARLVLTLMGHRRLLLRAGVGRVGVFVLVRAADDALEQLELRGEQVLVLLPRCPRSMPLDVDVDPTLNPEATAMQMAAAERMAACVEQSARVHLAEAKRHLSIASLVLAQAALGPSGAVIELAADEVGLLRANATSPPPRPPLQRIPLSVHTVAITKRTHSHASLSRGGSSSSEGDALTSSPHPLGSLGQSPFGDRAARKPPLKKTKATNIAGVGGADGENVDASMVVSEDELRRHLARSLAAHDA